MSIELIFGDCLVAMEKIPSNSVDMVLCDLPYGITHHHWDRILPFYQLWLHYGRIISPKGAILLFGKEPFSSRLRTSNIDEYRYDLYWEKERLANVLQCKKQIGMTIENISVFYKRQPTYNPQMVIYEGPKRKVTMNVPKISRFGNEENFETRPYTDNGTRYPTQLLKFKRDILTCNLHPAQKPVALCEYLIKTYSNENDTILDNCMGSGTTGVACVNTNRNFIGIEREQKYFDIAKERINKMISNIK